MPLMVYRESCRDVSLEIAEKTPVSTGKLLGQWAPSEGSSSSHTYRGGPSAWSQVPGGWQKDNGVAGTNQNSAMQNLVPRILSVTQTLSKQNPYYFTNDTPYARQAEHTGWKHTDRYHMVTSTRQNWQQIVNRSALRIKRG